MGLVNGSPGIVRDIIYEEDANIMRDLPIVVIVEFESYTGPSFFNDEFRKKWVPIYQKEIYYTFHNGSRTQLPLRLSYARLFTVLKDLHCRNAL